MYAVIQTGGKQYVAKPGEALKVEKVKGEETNRGFNAATDEFVDMVDAGVIDPTKVARCALQNAASVSGLMLTTEVMVTDIPEPKPETPMPGGHDHGMGGMGGMY